jgi:hypothetical protein
MEEWIQQAQIIGNFVQFPCAQRQRIDDLERLIGQLTVELDAAKKLSAMLR